MEDDKVVLEIEGNLINCSKAQLAKESVYFEVMFGGDFIEKSKEKIELRDVKVKCFLAILEILADKGNIKNYSETLDELLLILRTAVMLQFTAVQEHCVQPVLDLTTVDNVIHIWQFAEEFELKDLKMRARYLAVTEFEKIRKTDSFLTMDSEWFFRYLANRNLWCDREANVFEAGMLWITNNCEESEDVIYTLLCCLDFNTLSSSDIMEMQSHSDLKAFTNLVDILRFVLDKKSKQFLTKSTDGFAKAEFLLNSKPRIRPECPAFTIASTNVEEQNAVASVLGMEPQSMRHGLTFFYDGSNYKLITNQEKLYHTVQGQRIFGYKHYIFVFGGEFIFSQQTLATMILAYNIIKHKWDVIRLQMPFERCHFRKVVCGKYLYIIGGYGQYSLSENNMRWYNCEENCWSDYILFPKCRSNEIKFCQINKQLFIMDLSTENPKAFLFVHEESKWKEVTICPNSKIPVEGWNAVMFSYNNNIFVKGKHLMEFKLSDNQLILIKTKELELPPRDNKALDCCVYGDTLYVFYSHWGVDRRSVESFSLVTHTSTELKINPDQFFGFQHYDIYEKEDFVNDFLANSC